MLFAVAALIALFAPVADAVRSVRRRTWHRYIPPAWLPGGSPRTWLGTDGLGRDYLSRLILGTRISMLIGVSTIVLSGLIGTTLGVLGGYFGGKPDRW